MKAIKMINPNVAECEQRQQKARALIALKFDTVQTASVLYWHFLTIVNGD